MRQKNHHLTTLAIVVTLMIALSVAVSAQAPAPGPSQQPPIDVDPDSEEFENFADALVEVQEIQAGLNETINETIEESELGTTRFEEVHRIMQAPNSPDEGEDISEQESEAYADLMDDIQEVQIEAQETMVAMVEDHDLSVDRFNDMIRAVQQSEELQQALQNQQQSS